MTFEPRDYTALQRIDFNGVAVAFPGDGVTSSQVETLGLRLGIDVRPEREGLLEQPDADEPDREAWTNYALSVDGSATREALAELSLADLVAAYRDGGPEDAPQVGEPPALNAKKEEWVKYAMSREPSLTEEAANTLTRDQLIARFGPGGTLDQEQQDGFQRTQAEPDPTAEGQPFPK